MFIVKIGIMVGFPWTSIFAGPVPNLWEPLFSRLLNFNTHFDFEFRFRVLQKKCQGPGQPPENEFSARVNF